MWMPLAQASCPSMPPQAAALWWASLPSTAVAVARWCRLALACLPPTVLCASPPCCPAGNGALAGLVAITGGCAFVQTWAALIIGLVAGLVYYGSSKLVLHKMRVRQRHTCAATKGGGGGGGWVVRGGGGGPPLRDIPKAG